MRITETFTLCYWMGVHDFRALIFKILKFKNDVSQNSLYPTIVLGGNTRATFQKSAVAVGKEFGIAEGNLVTKNARSKVKEFATEM